MKYEPCGNSAFLKYYNNCASDAECYRIVKSDAGCVVSLIHVMAQYVVVTSSVALANWLMY